MPHEELDKYLSRATTSLLPPSLAAAIAQHEPGHGLISRPDLLHILAVGRQLAAEPALFFRIFVYIFLHLVIVPSLVF